MADADVQDPGVGVNWSDVGDSIKRATHTTRSIRFLQKNGVSPDAVAGWIKGGGEDDFRATYDAELQEGIKRGVEQRRAKQWSCQWSHDASRSFGDG